MLLIRLTGLLLSAAVPLSAAEWTVAPTGSDTTGAGTLAQPYATPQRALAQAKTGDTITLRAGAYPGGLTVENDKSQITFRSYAGETAVVTCSPTVDNPATYNTFWFRTPGCKLLNLDIQGGYYFCVACHAGQVLIDGCKIHGPGVAGVKLIRGADDVTIRRCEIYDTGKRGPNYSQGIDDVAGDRLHVADCSLHDVTDMAICVKGGAKSCVIERCRITNCWQGINLGQITDTDLVNTSGNPGYYECLDCITRNNLIVNTRYSGIGMWAAVRPQVLSNTILNAATLAQAPLFFNSTGHTNATQGCRDAVLRNNVATTLNPNLYMPNLEIRPQAIEGTLTLSNNCYYHGSNPAVFLDNRQYPVTPPWVVGPLAQWQTHSGTDAGSIDADPKLAADGTPLPGSPLLGAGMTLASVPDDLLANRRAGPTDIGAVQHLAPLPIPRPLTLFSQRTTWGGQSGTLELRFTPDAAPGAKAKARRKQR